MAEHLRLDWGKKPHLCRESTLIRMPLKTKTKVF